MRISGLEPGSVLHAVPGQGDITVQLQALGTTEAVHWLLDGRLAGTTGPDVPHLRLTLNGPGQHALTAMDTAGQYHRVAFSVK